MKRDLKVPYALDATGTVTAALTAPHGGTFTCLECSQPLALRRRHGHRPHFTHHGLTPRNCTGESVMHQAAKALLRAQIEQEIREHGRITWHLACPGVNGACREHVEFPQHHLVENWEQVELEVAHGPFRFDVAVTAGATVLFGFEVFFRHEVPEEKAEALDVPWLELLAEDILAYQPRRPHRPHYASTRCSACAALGARLAERAADDRARDQVGAEYQAEAQRVGATWKSVLAIARSHSKRAAARRGVQVKGEGSD